MHIVVGCQLFAAGRFFIAVTANVGRQASLGAWSIVFLVLVLVLVSVQQQVTACKCAVCSVLCRPQSAVQCQ